MRQPAPDMTQQRVGQSVQVGADPGDPGKGAHQQEQRQHRKSIAGDEKRGFAAQNFKGAVRAEDLRRPPEPDKPHDDADRKAQQDHDPQHEERQDRQPRAGSRQNRTPDRTIRRAEQHQGGMDADRQEQHGDDARRPTRHCHRRQQDAQRGQDLDRRHHKARCRHHIKERGLWHLVDHRRLARDSHQIGGFEDPVGEQQEEGKDQRGREHLQPVAKALPEPVRQQVDAQHGSLGQTIGQAGRGRHGDQKRGDLVQAEDRGAEKVAQDDVEDGRGRNGQDRRDRDQRHTARNRDHRAFNLFDPPDHPKAGRRRRYVHCGGRGAFHLGSPPRCEMSGSHCAVAMAKLRGSGRRAPGVRCGPHADPVSGIRTSLPEVARLSSARCAEAASDSAKRPPIWIRSRPAAT